MIRQTSSITRSAITVVLALITTGQVVGQSVDSGKRGDVKIVSPRPAKLAAELQFKLVLPFRPEANQKLELIEKYCEIAGTRSAASWNKFANEAESHIVVHKLWRNHEMIRCQTTYESFAKSSQVCELISQIKNPSEREPREGDIFQTQSCPIVGCLNGEFLEAYFPFDKVRLENQGDEILAMSATPFGSSRAWLSKTHGNLPRRIVIEKDAGNFLTRNLKVGDEQLNSNEPLSRLVSSRLELTVQEFERMQSGEFYIKRCRLEQSSTSKRGLEMLNTIDWVVNEIDFDPKSLRGAIYPKFDVAEGEKIRVQGTDLSYEWSPKKRWIIE